QFAEALRALGAEDRDVGHDHRVEAVLAEAERPRAEGREAVALRAAARAGRGRVEYPQRPAAIEEPVTDLFVGGADEEDPAVLEQLGEHGGYNLRRVFAALSLRCAHRLVWRPAPRLTALHYIPGPDRGSIDSRRRAPA